MRDCVRTNIYGQIESVLTRQEPLCPNPYTADSFPPEKKWIAYIMCDEIKNIYIHKCTSEDWEKYTTSSLSVVQNGLYCFAAVLNDKTTIWQVPAVCESFAKSVTRRQEAKSKVGWLHEICKQTMNLNVKVTFQFSMLNIYIYVTEPFSLWVNYLKIQWAVYQTLLTKHPTSRILLWTRHCPQKKNF